MFIPNEIDEQLWYLINADCDGTISEQESRQLADMLRSDPSALELYVDFLTVNADVFWLMSAKQRGMDVLRCGVSTEPVEEPAPRSTFLNLLGNFTDYLNQRLPLSLGFLLVVFWAMLSAATYFLDGNCTNPISVKKGEAVFCTGASLASPVAKRGILPAFQPLVPPTPDANISVIFLKNQVVLRI